MNTTSLLNFTETPVTKMEDILTSSAANTSSPTIGPESSMTSDVMQKTADAINLYIRPIILILGFFNNIVTLIIMRRPGMKNLSVSVYFCALAVSDCFVIILDWCSNVLNYIFGIDIVKYHVEVCRQYHYWLPVFFTWSAWLVVSIAVERVIVVTNPFRAKILCNPRNAIITCSVLFLLVFTFSWYHYPTWTHNEKGECTFHPDHLFFSMYINSWLTSVTYSYIPFIILVTCNCILFYNLARADRRRKAMTQTTESNRLADKFTKTAVSVCVTYLILTTPVSVYYTLIYANEAGFTSGFALLQSIAACLGMMNYAINFYLYIITSNIFRQEMKTLFKMCIPKSKKSEKPEIPSQTASSHVM